MKLLSAVENLNIEGLNEKIINSMYSAICLRIREVDIKEPDSDGAAYNNWEDKKDDLEEIREEIEELKKEFESQNDEKEIEKILDDLKYSIAYHQSVYKGLSKLKI